VSNVDFNLVKLGGPKSMKCLQAAARRGKEDLAERIRTQILILII
jgi:hypothetical protein